MSPTGRSLGTLAVPVLLALASGCTRSAAQPAGVPPEVVSPSSAEPETAPNTPLALFADYAAARANSQPDAQRLSALIAPESLLSGPVRLACRSQPAAVAIDLDPGRTTLNLADPPASAPGLADALTRIRAAGLRVFWISALPVADADRVYAVLRATGLDLDGTDRILLQRKASESSHQRLLAAARDWCFVALAGDRPGDFEPAMDYLRDPDGPIGQTLKLLIADGWFVIPQPID